MSERKTPVRMPGYKFRIFVTIVLLGIGWIAADAYQAIQGPLEGKLAIGQLNGTTEDYVVGAWFAKHNVVGMLWSVELFLLTCVWLPFVIKAGKFLQWKNAGTAALLLLGLHLTGCGPAPKVFYAEVGQNEGFIVTNLEGQTESEKLDTLSYLNRSTIQAKRVPVPMEKLAMDHGGNGYIYRAKVGIIRVNRAPVSCEWTKSEGTGTSSANQALLLKSLDGIFGNSGATMTASIVEGDEGLYCKSYGVQLIGVAKDGKGELIKSCISPVPDQKQYVISEYVARPLADVMEKDVRPYLQYRLSEQFGTDPVDKTRADLAKYYVVAFKQTKTFFAAQGLTILSGGSQEGVSYTNDEVQKIINDRVVAILDQTTAANELESAKKVNDRNVGKAEAEKDAATHFLKSVQAMQFRQQLELKKLAAQTAQERAEKWNKKLPDVILPGGENSPQLLLQVSTGK